MAVTGTCPHCGCEKTQYLNIQQSGVVGIDCPPGSGCDTVAGVELETALNHIPDDSFPLLLDST